jgi:hypothetical protein
MLGKSCLCLIAAVAGLSDARAPVREESPTCIALGVGTWTPETSLGIWRGSRLLTLTDRVEHGFDGVGSGRGWRAIDLAPPEAGGAPELLSAEYERAWLWNMPAPESLVVLRPAILSEGMSMEGAWRGDTLKGRAHAFSDAVGLRSPRANAYAVRYSCQARGADQRAMAAVEHLRLLDVADEPLAAREDSLWLIDVNARLRR